MADQQQVKISIEAHNLKYKKEFSERHGCTLKEMEDYIRELKLKKIVDAKTILRNKTLAYSQQSQQFNSNSMQLGFSLQNSTFEDTRPRAFSE